MAFRKVRVEGLPLTPELAKELAEMTPVPGEREEKETRRQFLLGHLMGGTFAGPSWAVGVSAGDGKRYRLDGQHSSKLLASLPDPSLPEVKFPEGLLVTVDTWEFDSLAEDAPPLFDLFNHPKSTRSNEDIMGIYRAPVATLADISRRMLKKIADGIAEQQRDLKDGWVYVARERGLYWRNPRWVEFACWVAPYGSDKNASFLSRAPIIAEMAADWLHDQATADVFWTHVFREDHPDPEHQTRELAETFRDWATAERKKGSDYRKKAATAWKRFLREARVTA